CFGHYRPSPNMFNSHRLGHRIIAPVPTKAAGLKRQFISSVYQVAIQTLQNTAEAAVAIGYSFNEADSDSYKPLLDQMAGKKVVVVCPDASEIIKRLAPQYQKINWINKDMSFLRWINAGYPGIHQAAH